MNFGHSVQLSNGKQVHVADNQYPVNLYCHIDGIQLAKRIEYDFTAYDCVTCHIPYSVRSSGIS